MLSLPPSNQDGWWEWSDCVVSTSSFLLSVDGVVRVGSDEQVRRVHAGRVVASMEYVEAFRDRRHQRLVAESVCLQLSVAESKRSVALLEARRGPFPAVIRASSVHFLPPPHEWVIHSFTHAIMIPHHILRRINRMIITIINQKEASQ